MFGALLEVELRKICTTPARESDLEVKIVKNWRSRDVFWGSKCVSRGRRKDFDTLQNTWQAQEFVRVAKTLAGVWFRALWCRCLKPPTLKPWKGCKFHVTEVLLCSDHFAWQLQDFVCLGSTFSWQAQYFWSIHLENIKTYWNSEAKCLLNMSILKEVSQKCFVFDLQTFNFEGSLAEMLCFWSSNLQFWRKSRRKAWFLSFKASFLKEVSQKSFVFELQSFIFEGSLAEKLRFWASQFQFWRKSRRNASFLSFKASILKEVLQKSFSVDLQSFVFEGSLAEMLRSWISKLQFWRKSRAKASLDKIIWITHQLTTKSFESQINWQPNQLNLKSIDNQNHLNLKSNDNQIIWLSTRLNLTSIDFRTNWTPHPPFL